MGHRFKGQTKEDRGRTREFIGRRTSGRDGDGEIRRRGDKAGMMEGWVESWRKTISDYEF